MRSLSITTISVNSHYLNSAARIALSYQVLSQIWQRVAVSNRPPSSLAEPRLLTGREGNTCSREMFDYVIRSKCVGVRDESLSMFSSEKRLRTDIDPSSIFLLITRSESLLNSKPYYIVLVSLVRHSGKERRSG